MVALSVSTSQYSSPADTESPTLRVGISRQADGVTMHECDGVMMHECDGVMMYVCDGGT